MSKTFTKEELAQILDDHSKWIRGVSEGKRANLRSANLRSANLRSANLRSADLYGANLRSADLYGANLRSANLRSADLYGANLRSANLRSADLYGADLYGADLYGADLYGADLRSANLYGADLYGADLESAQLSAFQIPEEGTFVAWKKVHNERGFGVILKLSIEGARTASMIGRKCRADRVVVLAAFQPGSKDPIETGETFHSKHAWGFVYRVGETISVPDYNPDPRVECTAGIHFFLTRAEAEAY
jgi:hypothetical protein